MECINKCYLCLCQVCTGHKCPFIVAHRYQSNICNYTRSMDGCPRVKCDYFVHKQKHKIYRIKRKHNKTDIQIDLLQQILKKLD